MATARTTKKVDPESTSELQLTYEQARDELLDVVNRLESGGESLAESMELFKRGESLASLCERYLSEARAVLDEARSNE